MKPERHNLFSSAVFLLAAAVSFKESLPAQQTGAATSPWELQNSTTKAGLRGIHAVGNGVAWASGTNGTILRTEDGGYMWQSCAIPPGAEKLDFRGVWAWDANTAVVMSSGPGDLSRLYKTTDGCSSWKLLYTNPDKDGFWDAIQFWDNENAAILGDPDLVMKSFVILISSDGGENWEKNFCAPLFPLDPHVEEQAAFAASNSSMVLGQPMLLDLRFGTSGPGSPHVFHWKSGHVFDMASVQCSRVPVPVAGENNSSGVFSLAFRDQKHGLAVGGDYKKPNESSGTGAYTNDGGKTWTAATKPPHGYRSAVAWDAADKAWIAVGTNGSDVSYDDGKTWQPLDNGNWNALSLPWAVGPEGRIAKLVSLKPAGISAK